MLNAVIRDVERT